MPLCCEGRRHSEDEKTEPNPSDHKPLQSFVVTIIEKDSSLLPSNALKKLAFGNLGLGLAGKAEGLW